MLSTPAASRRIAAVCRSTVANIEGMRRAVAGLAVHPGYVLTDGFRVPGLTAPNMAVIGELRDGRRRHLCRCASPHRLDRLHLLLVARALHRQG